MTSEQPKKLLILDILRILERYSDEDHRLSQQMIQNRLRQDYGMDASTKAIKNNLDCLEDFAGEFGYELDYTVIPRSKGGDENPIKTDYCLIRKFTDSELQFLIDSVVFSGKLPKHHAKQLVEKLYSLSSDYFKTKSDIASIPDSAVTANNSFFYNIEVIKEAIQSERQISFHYLEYRTDGELHRRRREDGSVREYRINPYHLASKDGRYYLICNNDKHDILSNYRVDRITDIRLLEDNKRKPFDKLKGGDGSMLDMKRYMEEHIRMFAGKSVRAELRIKKLLLSEMFDSFGRTIRFKDETEDSVTAIVTANAVALEQFAKESLPYIEVISPSSLRDKISSDIEKAMKIYTE